MEYYIDDSVKGGKPLKERKKRRPKISSFKEKKIKKEGVFGNYKPATSKGNIEHPPWDEERRDD